MAPIDTLDKALFTLLTEDPSVAGIVGAAVYPPPAAQNPTYPLVTYQQISGPRSYTHDGPDGMARARYQIDAWAKTSTEARELAEAVRVALSGYRGTVPGTDVKIDSAFLENEESLFEPDTALHRKTQDYQITFQESTL